MRCEEHARSPAWPDFFFSWPAPDAVSLQQEKNLKSRR
jgi:hypothetical protein